MSAKLQVQPLVAFVRGSTGQVVIRTQGYSPAWLPAGGGDWSDDRLAEFFIGEVNNLDSVRRVVEAGGLVSLFMYDPGRGSFIHFHIRMVREDLEFVQVL